MPILSASEIGVPANNKATMRRRLNLLIFNLRTDAADDVLGFTTDWLNAVAPYWNQVFVITMAVGKIDVAPNVHVFSLGRERSYSKPHRFARFYALLGRLLATERIDACFAHMAPLFAVMAWPVLSPLNIPILLWYAHHAKPRMLKVAHWLVDRVVTSHPNAFTLESRKAHVIGQGITESKFQLRPFFPRSSPFMLLSIARLSAIKHIDTMILAIARLVTRHGRKSARLVLLGEALTAADQNYKRHLLRIVAENELMDNVVFAGAVPHGEVPNWLRQADLTINLAPHFDKAGLESLAAGVPLLFFNASFSDVIAEAGVDPARYRLRTLSPDCLADQIESWMHVDNVAVRSELERISATVLDAHGLRRLAACIHEQIEQLLAARKTSR